MISKNKKLIALLITGLLVFLCLIYLNQSYNLIFIAKRSIQYLYSFPTLFIFFTLVCVGSIIKFQKREYLFAILLIIGGWIFNQFHKFLIAATQDIGTDSLIELFSFNHHEALFFLGTIFDIDLIFLEWKQNLLIVIASFITASVFVFIIGKIFVTVLAWKYNFLALFLGCVSVVGYSLSSSFELRANALQSLTRLGDNFDSMVPFTRGAPKLNLFIYVGESTTSMNMGIYGYPRDTTPRLSERLNQESIIKFDNILSTHTHTTPSLLEAFSFDFVSMPRAETIFNIKRVPIFEIIEKSGFNIKTISNQVDAGSWTIAGDLIFQNIEYATGENVQDLAKYGELVERNFDHEIFNQSFTKETLEVDKPSVFVFHSYTGHGPYLRNVPENFRIRVDSFFDGLSGKAIYGNAVASDFEAYDAAIKYIDFNVSEAIAKIERSSKPWAFIYFADHGESVFTGRGHDSGRFSHEMAAIPFLMAFNHAAKESAPDLFRIFTNLSGSGNPATLGQLAPTIFHLLNISVPSIRLPIIGSKFDLEPILVRETRDGISGIILNKRDSSNVMIANTVGATEIFKASRQSRDVDPILCYHRSNSIAKALRGKLVTDCLEFDIEIYEEEIFVFHAPAKNTGLTLEKYFEIFDSKADGPMALWLDSKNLLSAETCDTLRRFLVDHRSNGELKILVEFPTSSISKISKLKECGSKLKRMESVFTSYYLSTERAINCSELINNTYDIQGIDSCTSLRQSIESAAESSFFTDLSFDYRGLKAVEAVSREIDKDFKWNTWNVEPSDTKTVQDKRFRMVILQTDDPNNI